VLAVLFSACGSGASTGEGSTTAPGAGSSTTAASGTTTTSGTPPTTGSRQLTIALYLMRGDVLGVAHRRIPATKQVGKAALDALFAGPDALERAAGLVSDVPAGTRLLGLTITGGVATADVSDAFESGGGSLSMTARLAELVYTLTQFPSVQKVRLKVNGQVVTALGGEGILLEQPVGRLDPTLLNVVPPILLESPAVGDSVRSPLHVTGMSNTFEATYRVQLLDATGGVLVDSFGTATAGTGTWGTFDATFPYAALVSGTGTLRVFEASAKDGSPVNEVDLALPVGP